LTDLQSANRAVTNWQPGNQTDKPTCGQLNRGLRSTRRL